MVVTHVSVVAYKLGCGLGSRVFKRKVFTPIDSAKHAVGQSVNRISADYFVFFPTGSRTIPCVLQQARSPIGCMRADRARVKGHSC